MERHRSRDLTFISPSCSQRAEMKNNVGVAVVVEYCFTSTETVGLLGTGAQDVHLEFHTAPEYTAKQRTENQNIVKTNWRVLTPTRAHPYT